MPGDVGSSRDRRSGRLILRAFVLALAFAVATVVLVVASQHKDSRPPVTCNQTGLDQGCA
jgi:hypothetical protein